MAPTNMARLNMAQLNIPLTLHEADDDDFGQEHFHMTKWHYVAIAAVLAVIVLVILFTPIGGSAMRLPF